MSEVIGGKQMARKRAKNKPKDVALPRQRSPLFRSRVSRGLDLLPDIDGRSHWARLMRDTLDALIAHCGGQDTISEPKRMMARRAACLETELIFLETKFATIRAEGGEPTLANVEIYGRLAGNQRRIAEALGWERSARDITPTLAELLME